MCLGGLLVHLFSRLSVVVVLLSLETGLGRAVDLTCHQPQLMEIHQDDLLASVDCSHWED